MTIDISPELAKYVEDKVKTGQYVSPEDVVNGALRLLKIQETWTPDDVEELRREIAIGIEELDCGDSAPWSVDEIKADGRRMLAARQG